MSPNAFLAALVALPLALGLARAEGPTAFTPAERAALLKAILRDPLVVRHLDGKKVVLSGLARFEVEPEPGLPRHTVVEALHFRYDDGATIRTTYSPALKKVREVECLIAYPTPLAAEEVREARKLAAGRDPRYRTLLDRYTDEGLDVRAIAPVISERTHPRFGKRLAVLFVRPRKKGPEPAFTVTVNLTDRTVHPE